MALNDAESSEVHPSLARLALAGLHVLDSGVRRDHLGTRFGGADRDVATSSGDVEHPLARADSAGLDEVAADCGSNSVAKRL